MKPFAPLPVPVEPVGPVYGGHDGAEVGGTNASELVVFSVAPSYAVKAAVSVVPVSVAPVYRARALLEHGVRPAGEVER